jgi:hypothetical protein
MILGHLFLQFLPPPQGTKLPHQGHYEEDWGTCPEVANLVPKETLTGKSEHLPLTLRSQL